MCQEPEVESMNIRSLAIQRQLYDDDYYSREAVRCREQDSWTPVPDFLKPRAEDGVFQHSQMAVASGAESYYRSSFHLPCQAMVPTCGSNVPVLAFSLDCCALFQLHAVAYPHPQNEQASSVGLPFSSSQPTCRSGKLSSRCSSACLQRCCTSCQLECVVYSGRSSPWARR